MPAPRRLLLLLPALLALLVPLAPARAPGLHGDDPAPGAAKVAAPLERVAVIGASVSAGFGLQKDEKGGQLNLARVVDAGLLAGHGPLFDASSELTFIDAPGTAKSVARKLEKHDPTLVVALDYLFWFGYGTSWDGQKERLAALELGLKSLEGLRCPILLGDFPDMRTALSAKEPMLPPQAVPDPDTLARLNERIAAWAKEHTNVIVVPVSKLMQTLLARQDLRIGPNLWPKDAVAGLLQADGLHTTLEGTTALWLFAAERLREARKDLPSGALEPRADAIDGKLAPGEKLKVLHEPIRGKRGKSAPAKTVH